MWYNQFVKKNWGKPSKIKGFSPVLFRTGETKNKTVFGLPYFLSNPKDWYVISHKRGRNQFALRTVCYQVVRLVCFSFRIDYIPPYGGLHPTLRVDYIPQQVADYMQGPSLICLWFYAILLKR